MPSQKKPYQFLSQFVSYSHRYPFFGVVCLAPAFSVKLPLSQDVSISLISLQLALSQIVLQFLLTNPTDCYGTYVGHRCVKNKCNFLEILATV